MVVDISNPAAPVAVGSLSMPDVVMDLAVTGDNLFVANRDAGVAVIDVSDPAAPAEVSRYSAPCCNSRPNGIAASNGLVYVADGNSGRLLVLDASDPTSLSLLSTFTADSTAAQVLVEGSHAYLMAGDVHVLDVSDPLLPAEVLTLWTPDLPRGIALGGGDLYVALGNSGVVRFTDLPSACAATCGNGTRELPEECDDGNVQSDDGCSASCQEE